MKHIVLPVKQNPLSFVFISGLLILVAYQRLPMFFNELGQEGRPAPDFELIAADGKTVRLSDFRGKKVALNFWATWCPPCRVEIPILNSFYEELPGDVPFALLAVTAESREVVHGFLAENPIKYPVLLDPNGAVTEGYRIMAYPTFVYVDEEGNISDIDSGINFFLKWKLRYLATGGIF